MNASVQVMRLDRRSVREQIADYYIDYIKCGRIEAGDRLPGRTEVAMIWNVSLRQAQQALQLIRQRGWAVSVQGAGSYAARPELGTA